MSWLGQILLRRRIDRDVDDEIRGHIEERIAALVAEGVAPDEARLEALREFGNITLTVEKSRAVWRWSAVEQLFGDVRYTLRQLRRAPAFTAASVLTLALGIGANTAVFSIVNAVVLRPLPYPDSDRLVSVQSLSTEGGAIHPDNLSYPQFFDFRARNRVFEHMVCWRDNSAGLSGGGPAINVPGEIVSWELFETLHVPPMLGRGFVKDDEAAGQRVVVLGHRLWTERFGADPSIVGRSIELNRQSFMVVGVAPAGFAFPPDNPEAQIWTTLSVDASSATRKPMTEQPGARIVNALARLKPGVPLSQAKAEMNALSAAQARADAEDYGSSPSALVEPEIDTVVGDSRRPILILLGAVGLVLLVACANVANLLLARTAERQREFAVRASIGAGRARIVRQLLAEGFTLALFGSAAGVLLAAGCVKAVVKLAATSIPRIEQAGVDEWVLLFSVALAFVTNILFSLAPAARLSRMELISPLKESSRGNAAAGDRFRSALVVVQIALGLVLLSGAGLLASSFLQLLRRDIGFRPDGLLTFSIGLPQAITRGTAHIGFESRVMDRIRALPGVRSTAVAIPIPLAGSQVTIGFEIEQGSGKTRHAVSDVALVTPDYFNTVGIPVLEGRALAETDDASSPPVLVVNRAFADKFFPGERAIGKRIEPGATAVGVRTGMREIVGIVGNARQNPLGTVPDPIYYYAEKQLPWCCLKFLVRTTGSMTALESSVRAVVASIDPSAPVYAVHPMEETLSKSIAAPRFQMLLLGAFAAIALLLTAVVLYGVLAYSVSSRTREIGIRIALGADRRTVLRMVLADATILVALGVALGFAGALAGNRLAKSMVHMAGMPQPALMAVACAVVVITAALAAMMPARRAASVDPMQALRNE